MKKFLIFLFLLSEIAFGQASSSAQKDASATQPGRVNTNTQTFTGSKTFTSPTIFSDTTTGTKISKFSSDSVLAGNGTIGLVSAGSALQTFYGMKMFNDGLGGPALAIPGQTDVNNQSAGTLTLSHYRASGTTNLHGLSGGSDGQVLNIANLCTGCTLIIHDAAGESQNQAIYTPTGTDLTITGVGGAVLFCDSCTTGTSGSWKIISYAQ